MKGLFISNKMGKKIRVFINNRFNLIAFYIFFILFVAMPFCRQYTKWMELFRCFIYIPWGLYFIFIDLLNRKRFNAGIYMALAFVFFAMISIVLVPFSPSYTQIRMVFNLLISVYILCTSPFFYKKDDWIRRFSNVSMVVFYSIAIFNILNLLLFILLRMNVVQDVGYFEGIRYGSLKYHGLYAATPTIGKSSLICLLLAFYLHSKSKINLTEFLGSVLSCFILIILSFHRTSLICIGVVLLIIITRFLLDKVNKRAVVIFIRIVVFSLIISISFFFVKHGLTFETLNSYSSLRWSIWADAIKLFLERPIFGWGYCNTEAIQGTYQSAHNLFITSLVWTGVCGTGCLTLFLLFCFLSIRTKWKILRNHIWIVIIFLCMLIESMLEGAIIGDDTTLITPFFWLCAGFIVFFLNVEEIGIDTDKLVPISVEDQKHIQFDILKYVAKYCEEKGLKYVLFHGSLLGAIRHKGFIPWDDDIDIAMPRPDFERLIAEFDSGGKYKAIGPDNPSSRFFYMKIIDTDTIKIEKGIDYDNDFLGVDIDVFPIDGTSSDESDYNRLKDQIRVLYQKHYLIAHGFTGTWRHSILVIANRILYGPASHIIKKAIQLCKTYSYDNCEFVTFYDVLYRPIKVRKEVFDDYIYSEFETEKFRISKGYDEILKQLFGDYMILPPEDKRVSHHSQKSYWKKTADL